LLDQRLHGGELLILGTLHGANLLLQESHIALQFHNLFARANANGASARNTTLVRDKLIASCRSEAGADQTPAACRFDTTSDRERCYEFVPHERSVSGAGAVRIGASKEIMELQRDMALLQEQVRTMQRAQDEKFAAMQALVQQTLDSVTRTNTTLAVMENKFNEAMRQQQQTLSGPVANVGQKLDQMAEDFRAVRESVLDMNSRISKLDAKMADLQNLINTMRNPAPPPPTGDNNGASNGLTGQAPAGPPAGMQAAPMYTNAYRDYKAGKYDLAMQSSAIICAISEHGFRTQCPVLHRRHLLSKGRLRQRPAGLRCRAGTLSDNSKTPTRTNEGLSC